MSESEPLQEIATLLLLIHESYLNDKFGCENVLFGLLDLLNGLRLLGNPITILDAEKFRSEVMAHESFGECQMNYNEFYTWLLRISELMYRAESAAAFKMLVMNHIVPLVSNGIPDTTLSPGLRLVQPVFEMLFNFECFLKMLFISLLQGRNQIYSYLAITDINIWLMHSRRCDFTLSYDQVKDLFAVLEASEGSQYISAEYFDICYLSCMRMHNYRRDSVNRKEYTLNFSEFVVLFYRLSARPSLYGAESDFGVDSSTELLYLISKFALQYCKKVVVQLCLGSSVSCEPEDNALRLGNAPSVKRGGVLDSKLILASSSARFTVNHSVLMYFLSNCGLIVSDAAIVSVDIIENAISCDWSYSADQFVIGTGGTEQAEFVLCGNWLVGRNVYNRFLSNIYKILFDNLDRFDVVSRSKITALRQVCEEESFDNSSEFCAVFACLCPSMLFSNVLDIPIVLEPMYLKLNWDWKSVGSVWNSCGENRTDNSVRVMDVLNIFKQKRIIPFIISEDFFLTVIKFVLALPHTHFTVNGDEVCARNDVLALNVVYVQLLEAIFLFGIFIWGYHSECKSFDYFSSILSSISGFVELGDYEVKIEWTNTKTFEGIRNVVLSEYNEEWKVMKKFELSTDDDIKTCYSDCWEFCMKLIKLLKGEGFLTTNMVLSASASPQKNLGEELIERANFANKERSSVGKAAEILIEMFSDHSSEVLFLLLVHFPKNIVTLNPWEIHDILAFCAEYDGVYTKPSISTPVTRSKIELKKPLKEFCSLSIANFCEFYSVQIDEIVKYFENLQENSLEVKQQLISEIGQLISSPVIIQLLSANEDLLIWEFFRCSTYSRLMDPFTNADVHRSGNSTDKTLLTKISSSMIPAIPDIWKLHRNPYAVGAVTKEAALKWAVRFAGISEVLAERCFGECWVFCFGNDSNFLEIESKRSLLFNLFVIFCIRVFTVQHIESLRVIRKDVALSSVLLNSLLECTRKMLQSFSTHLSTVQGKMKMRILPHFVYHPSVSLGSTPSGAKILNQGLGNDVSALRNISRFCIESFTRCTGRFVNADVNLFQNGVKRFNFLSVVPKEDLWDVCRFLNYCKYCGIFGSFGHLNLIDLWNAFGVFLSIMQTYSPQELTILESDNPLHDFGKSSSVQLLIRKAIRNIFLNSTDRLESSHTFHVVINVPTCSLCSSLVDIVEKWYSLLLMCIRELEGEKIRVSMSMNHVVEETLDLHVERKLAAFDANIKLSLLSISAARVECALNSYQSLEDDSAILSLDSAFCLEELLRYGGLNLMFSLSYFQKFIDVSYKEFTKMSCHSSGLVLDEPMLSTVLRALTCCKRDDRLISIDVASSIVRRVLHSRIRKTMFKKNVHDKADSGTNFHVRNAHAPFIMSLNALTISRQEYEELLVNCAFEVFRSSAASSSGRAVSWRKSSVGINKSQPGSASSCVEDDYCFHCNERLSKNFRYRPQVPFQEDMNFIFNPSVVPVSNSWGVDFLWPYLCVFSYGFSKMSELVNGFVYISMDYYNYADMEDIVAEIKVPQTVQLNNAISEKDSRRENTSRRFVSAAKSNNGSAADMLNVIESIVDGCKEALWPVYATYCSCGDSFDPGKLSGPNLFALLSKMDLLTDQIAFADISLLLHQVSTSSIAEIPFQTEGEKFSYSGKMSPSGKGRSSPKFDTNYCCESPALHFEEFLIFLCVFSQLYFDGSLPLPPSKSSNNASVWFDKSVLVQQSSLYFKRFFLKNLIPKLKKSGSDFLVYPPVLARPDDARHRDMYVSVFSLEFVLALESIDEEVFGCFSAKFQKGKVVKPIHLIEALKSLSLFPNVINENLLMKLVRDIVPYNSNDNAKTNGNSAANWKLSLLVRSQWEWVLRVVAFHVIEYAVHHKQRFEEEESRTMPVQQICVLIADVVKTVGVSLASIIQGNKDSIR